MGFTVPHFPEMEDESGGHVCPSCLEVLGPKQKPDVHWIRAGHAFTDAQGNQEAAKRIARGETDGAKKPQKEEADMATATQEQKDRYTELTKNRVLAATKRSTKPEITADEKKELAELEKVLGKDATGSNSSGTKRAAASGGSRPKYSEEIVAAAKRANEIISPKTGNPGPKQHELVRKVVEKELGKGKVTPAAIVSLAGAKSAKHLREIAERKAPRADLPPLRPLAEKCGNDPWAKGRHLALILTVWIESLK